MQKKILRPQIKKHIKYLQNYCHPTKNEPRNVVNPTFLGSCTLFKLVPELN